MESDDEIKVGIGFVTGRSNVCDVINSYYKDILEQIEKTSYNIKVTFFILYDTTYQGTPKEEFYKINPNVFNKFNIIYISPEEREEEKKKLEEKNILTYEEAELFFGNGHAKGRNTVLYFALRNKMDYLLFWDDDEYPVACIKEDDKIIWKKQDNVIKHIEEMEKNNADVTVGYHCGYISPIPYLNVSDNIEEDNIQDFIEAISNELVSYKSINEKFKKDNGVTFAEENLADGQGAYELRGEDGNKFVAGSTLCLNLQHIDKIPAFYNPPSARGEDTFFSMNLENSKVIKVPVYHFHDGFLKYTGIIKGRYPKKLRKIKIEEENIESRFLKASKGWIKYKPLLMYIQDKENYKENIKEAIEKLEKSVPKINKLFESENFTDLVKDLKEYDKNVEKHYKEYIKTNEIWNKLKNVI